MSVAGLEVFSGIARLFFARAPDAAGDIHAQVWRARCRSDAAGDRRAKREHGGAIEG